MEITPGPKTSTFTIEKGTYLLSVESLLIIIIIIIILIIIIIIINNNLKNVLFHYIKTIYIYEIIKKFFII